MTEDETTADASEATESVEPVDAAEEKAPKATKAEKLEAKAARLREAELIKAAKTAQPRANTGLVVALGVVSVVLLVLFGLCLGYALHERSRSESAASLAATRSSATRAATQIATDFGSYDYTTLKADFARTASFLTPTLEKHYAQVSAALEATITANHGKIVGTVRGVAISSISRNRKTAVALVFLDQSVTSSTSKTARIDRNRVEMTLVRQKNGGWLASALGLE